MDDDNDDAHRLACGLDGHGGGGDMGRVVGELAAKAASRATHAHADAARVHAQHLPKVVTRIEAMERNGLVMSIWWVGDAYVGALVISMKSEQSGHAMD